MTDALPPPVPSRQPSLTVHDRPPRSPAGRRLPGWHPSRPIPPARNWPVIAGDLTWLLVTLVMALALTALMTWAIYDLLMGVMQ